MGILDGLFSTPLNWFKKLETFYKNIVSEVAQEQFTTPEKSDFSDEHFVDKALTWATSEAVTFNKPDTAIKIISKKYSGDLFTPAQAMEYLDARFKADHIDIIGVHGFLTMRQVSDVEVSRVFENVKSEVRNYIQQAVVDGIPREIAVDRIRAMGFSKGYAEMVYQTTTNTAINGAIYNGAVKSGGLIKGFRLKTMNDSKVRGNHFAAHNLEQYIDSAFWDYLFPPLGYNCRCRVIPLEIVRRYEPPMINLARADYDYFGKRPVLIYTNAKLTHV